VFVCRVWPCHVETSIVRLLNPWTRQAVGVRGVSRWALQLQLSRHFQLVLGHGVNYSADLCLLALMRAAPHTYTRVPSPRRVKNSTTARIRCFASRRISDHKISGERSRCYQAAAAAAATRANLINTSSRRATLDCRELFDPTHSECLLRPLPREEGTPLFTPQCPNYN